jgi:hypothetical protein
LFHKSVAEWGSFFGYDHVLTEAQTARANSSD